LLTVFFGTFGVCNNGNANTGNSVPILKIKAMRNKPDQYFHERSYDHVTLRLICVLAMGIRLGFAAESSSKYSISFEVIATSNHVIIFHRHF